MKEIKFDASKIDLENLKQMNNTFFEWWEAFTELAYSKNLEPSESVDYIRDIWYSREDFSIEEAIKNFTR